MPYPATVDYGINLTYYNVKDYGAKGDSVTDDTNAIAAAITAATTNGGVIFFPPGTFLSGTQTLQAKVNFQGSGITATTLKLKNGANTDLLSAQTSQINLSAGINAGITGTVYNFSIQDMTLDGNKANQTAGPSYPLRFYGYNFILRDLEVLNGYTGGMLIDWNGPSLIASPSDDMEALVDVCKVHDCNGIGIQMGGPHDSKMRDTIVWANGSHNFHFAPNCTGLLGLNLHGYDSANTTGVCCMIVEGTGCQFTNCVMEGAYYTNVVALATQFSWIAGNIYAGPPNWTNAIGIQMGQIAGQTPYPGQIFQSAGVTTAAAANNGRIDSLIIECRGGALKLANESSNVIIANIYQTVGTALVGEAINTLTDTFQLNIQGFTSTNTRGTSGATNFVTNGGSLAFTVNDIVNGQLFQIDNNGNLYLRGGFNTSSGYYFNASSVAGALATGGTIGLQGLPNISVAPTADVTGVILQAGYPGQLCIVTNASAFTITFAASGTSHVAPGTACKIAANSACIFYYNTTTSLWEPTSYTVLPAQSLTAVAVASSGTITTTDTDVSRVAPTAAVTGVILQSGVYAGQRVVVENESAFTLTMAASGTSHVVGGVADTIGPTAGRTYTWDSSNSLWYPDVSYPVQSATAVVTATSGTIATAGLDSSRVAPAAAVTGVILASGTYAAQQVTVLNESAFSITFAASGTSHVADGVSDVIAATNGRLFRWNSGTSLWYPCK